MCVCAGQGGGGGLGWVEAPMQGWVEKQAAVPFFVSLPVGLFKVIFLL